MWARTSVARRQLCPELRGADRGPQMSVPKNANGERSLCITRTTCCRPCRAATSRGVTHDPATCGRSRDAALITRSLGADLACYRGVDLPRCRGGFLLASNVTCKNTHRV